MALELGEPTVRLIPVSEWTFCLFRVDYYAVNEPLAGVTKPVVSRYLVSTDTHLDEEAQENGPGHWVMYEYTEIAVVSRPREVGRLYGCRVDETARAAGEREARARGLM